MVSTIIRGFGFKSVLLNIAEADLKSKRRHEPNELFKSPSIFYRY